MILSSAHFGYLMVTSSLESLDYHFLDSVPHWTGYQNSRLCGCHRLCVLIKQSEGTVTFPDFLIYKY